MKEIFPHIIVDQETQFGRLVIKGTRVPVEVVVGHIAAGMTIEEVMREYNIGREEVVAALKYATKIVAEEMVLGR